LLIEDLVATTDAAASWREAAAVAGDIDIPARDLLRRRGTSDAVWTLGLRRGRVCQRQDRERRDAQLMHLRWSPRRRLRYAKARSRCCDKSSSRRAPREVQPASAGHNRLVNRAALNDDGWSFQCHRPCQHWFLQLRFPPTLAVIDRDIDAPDLAVAAPGDTADLMKIPARSAAGRPRDA
jgi:hypothetical protein